MSDTVSVGIVEKVGNEKKAKISIFLSVAASLKLFCYEEKTRPEGRERKYKQASL